MIEEKEQELAILKYKHWTLIKTFKQFNIERFRETQQKAIVNLLKGIKCFSFKAYGLKEIFNFTVFSAHRRWAAESSPILCFG